VCQLFAGSRGAFAEPRAHTHTDDEKNALTVWWASLTVQEQNQWKQQLFGAP